jgi:hypothetical protein
LSSWAARKMFLPIRPNPLMPTFIDISKMVGRP